MALTLAQDPDADAPLDRDSLALLIGMLLDQQFPMERAFAGPALLARRLGRDALDPHELAGYDPVDAASLSRVREYKQQQKAAAIPGR